ncbi:MAG TPA: methyltransferase domain-containing protein [Planctomycetota bacterium]|nr:methyltransferase domain-containing protein [Planctomycetota bacterium]
MTLEFPERADEAGRVWDRIAAWWDDRIGDGNATQDLLVEPAQERLLALAPGETVLDVACGAGRFARRMAARGARVVAFDRCEPFLERARRRTAGEAIAYHRIDATDRDAMLALGHGRFDAAVCTMALMDIACLDPLLEALPELLKPQGRFVFSVTHPSFNSGDARMEADGSVRVTDYATPRATLSEGIRGQPEPHVYLHRPLGAMLNAWFERGFVLDRLEEPPFPAEGRTGSSWPRGIPPVLVARLIPRGRR